jgi:hypothetical protein
MLNYEKNEEIEKTKMILSHGEAVSKLVDANVRIAEQESIIAKMKNVLIEVKKDIETNASDTLWSHDCGTMTCVDRIYIALEEFREKTE